MDGKYIVNVQRDTQMMKTFIKFNNRSKSFSAFVYHRGGSVGNADCGRGRKTDGNYILRAGRKLPDTDVR